MKRYKLKIPIYDYKILIYIGEIEKLADKYLIEENLSNVEAFVCPLENSKYKLIVAFRKKVKYSVIVHEVVHLVNRVFKSRGVELDVDNDETQAYLTEWIFKEIVKKIKH